MYSVLRLCREQDRYLTSEPFVRFNSEALSSNNRRERMATSKSTAPAKKSTQPRTKRVEISFTKEQIKAVEAVFGPEIAKKMTGLVVAKTGASVYSHPVMN